jgi:hypothetical protein
MLAMNKTSDEVTLRNDDLVEVLECNRHYGGDDPEGLTIKVGTQKTVVDRKRLFAFVNTHGDICGKRRKNNNVV